MLSFQKPAPDSRTAANAAILAEVAQLINSDRAKEYGDAYETHQRIAALWSPLLGTTITPEQVVMCMVAVKLARLCADPQHRDSYVDICGYSALGGGFVDMQDGKK